MKKRLVLDSVFFAYVLIAILYFLFDPREEVQKLALLSRWDLGLLILATSLSLSWSLVFFKQGSLGALVFDQNFRSRESQQKFWLWQIWIFFLLTLWFSLQATQFSWVELFDKEGFKGAVRLFQGLSHPNFALLPRAVLNMIETIFMAFVATILALPVAFLLAFPCAKNIMSSSSGFVFYFLLRMFFNIVRSVEALIWAIIFSVWVGIGPFAGMLALMAHSIASLTKQFSEIVESVDEGPLEAIASTGANRTQVIWYGIVPQVLLPFISFSIYRWDINVRMATVIGLVGGGGIGTLLIQYQGQAMWPEVGCIVFVIAIVVWLMDTASAYLREALK